MVRVVKMGMGFYGIDEKDCDGDFWEEVQVLLENGASIIIADDRYEAEEICADVIEWYEGDE